MRLPSEAKLEGKDRDLILSDGGLTDNLGVDLLLERHYNDTNWQADLMIVSDGGQIFEDNFGDRRTWTLDELPRAIDVIYQRAAWRSVLQAATPPMVFLRPADFKMDNLKKASYSVFRNTSTLQISRFREAQANALFQLKHWLRRTGRQ